MDCNTCVILSCIIIPCILTILILIIINNNCNSCNKCTDSFTNKDSRHKSLEKLVNDNNISYVLDKKLCEFWINSSHNSFLENYQVLGESRVSNLTNTINSGARCVELDIHDGVTAPIVMHTGSAPGWLTDFLQVIKDNAFTNTSDPFILYLEIFGTQSETHMKRIGNLIKAYLGDRLYEGTMNIRTIENYCFNVPIRKLLGKIIIVINYYNMNTPDGKGLDNRDKYLFPICHATTDEPSGGWFKELGPLIKGVGADDSITLKPKNQVIRVYPNNTLKSSNYNPDVFWSNNYNIVALNFGNEDDNMKKNNKKFKYCSLIPFDIIISDNGTVYKSSQYLFPSSEEWKAPIYSNVRMDSNLILPNKAYNNGTTWWSNDNKYYLTMQSDGNLVLYNNKNKPLWSSKTSGNPNSILYMQKDGNLVIYNYNNYNNALWHSGTHGNPGSYAALTDGNLISNADFNIYNYTGKKIKQIY